MHIFMDLLENLLPWSSQLAAVLSDLKLRFSARKNGNMITARSSLGLADPGKGGEMGIGTIDSTLATICEHRWNTLSSYNHCLNDIAILRLGIKDLLASLNEFIKFIQHKTFRKGQVLYWMGNYIKFATKYPLFFKEGFQ